MRRAFLVVAKVIAWVIATVLVYGGGVTGCVLLTASSIPSAS